MRFGLNHLSVAMACVLACAGCEHRQKAVPAAAAPPSPTSPPPILATVLSATKTYHCPTGDIQFDYPADWEPDKGTTSVFAVAAPAAVSKGHSCLNLDVPKLPAWVMPRLITVNMVAKGYEDDLKKNEMHDAVKEEDCPLSVPGAKAERITSTGHDHGKPLIDTAVILIHADRVYIFSADSDDQGRDSARRTLDSAIASLKWTK